MRAIDENTIAALREGDHAAFERVFRAFFGRVKAFIFGYVKSAADAEELAEDVFVGLWMNRAALDPSRSFSSYLHTVARNTALNFLRHKLVRDRYAAGRGTGMGVNSGVGPGADYGAKAGAGMVAGGSGIANERSGTGDDDGTGAWSCASAGSSPSAGKGVYTSVFRSGSATPEDEVIARETALLIEMAVERMPAQRREIYRLSRVEGLPNGEIADRLGTTKRTVESQLSAALKDIKQVIFTLFLLLP